MRITDVNGFVPERVNISVFLKSGNNVESVFEGNVSSYNYVIADDMLGDYSLIVDAQGEYNAAHREFPFTVKDSLSISLLYPDKTLFKKNENIPVIIKIFDVNGREVRGRSINSIVRCNVYESSLSFSTIINPFPDKKYYNVYYTYQCFAPREGGRDFTLKVSVSDPHGNFGEKELKLSTEGEALPQAEEEEKKENEQKEGGEEGDKNFCYCTGWKDEGCWLYDCEDFESYQTRFCYPRGCRSESRCVRTSSCSGKKDVELLLPKRNYEVVQGERINLPLKIENVGEVTLYLNVDVELECCNPSYPRKVIVFPRSSLILNVALSAPLAKQGR